jgi:hypothetical protein
MAFRTTRAEACCTSTEEGVIVMIKPTVSDYVAHHNDNPKPFIWTATASDILEKVKRARKKLDKLQSL